MPIDPLQKTPLGRTDLSVSRICFGTSSLGDMPGTYGYDVSEDRARETVRAIFSGPVNFLDTSRIYGFGRSEERIGDVIRERGGLPEGFVLSTKLDRDPETNRFDASQARRSLEESLRALGLDRLDLLHLHDPEHADSLEATTGAQGALAELFRMKEEGLVKAVGLAAGPVDVMMPLLRDWSFDAMITHNRFTLANRNAEAMISFAHSKGIAVLNAAPYAGGVLAKGSDSYPRYVYQEASEDVLDPIRQIESVCAKHGVPPGAVALQFSMRDERITSTICGVSKPERVAQTLEWARCPIPQSVWDELASLTYSTDDPEASRQYNPG
ncbi:aldo/keto reductase [Microvirga sp. BSC39]|uniref:aldo/keto reductase n=1 Tax=Microvirga sp. BSC39 TaxID=1549810 RepID=UPI0004E8DF6D|nr:aldo/keto reductase [Microvirga sp. BSC39]KFG68603.1 oxidoreductase [Microvirga sp. BSC39]